MCNCSQCFQNASASMKGQRPKTFREKTNPDQPKHIAQAYPDRHDSPTVDFLFQESLLYTSIPPDTE